MSEQVHISLHDTARLNWVLQHTGARFDFDWRKQADGATENNSHWIIWYQESQEHVAYGKDYRECIDNAILGNFKSY